MFALAALFGAALGLPGATFASPPRLQTGGSIHSLGPSTRSGAAGKTAIVPTDPSANIPIRWSAAPAACSAAPAGVSCETFALHELDAARASVGLPPYAVPASFLSASATEQVFILTNLDRGAYGMQPIAALNRSLDAAAAAGAAEGSDPQAPAAFLSNVTDGGWSANWAGGYPNILFAYYSWMYDDGYGSGNLDCTSPSSEGCWGHRRDILAFPTIPTTAMGVATAEYNGEPSFAQLIVARVAPPT